MIKNTFLFLEKIGAKKEKNLWQRGLKDWNDFLQAENIPGISRKSKQYYNRKIREAQSALLEENYSYFIGKLPQKEMWRLYSYFKENCCFLDLETDSYGKIILLGISDYFQTKHFLQGVNLEKSLIEKELVKYGLIITFNGSSFDLPKLRKQLKISLNLPHIDLKPACVNLGLKGGLKKVERILNLYRPTHLHGNPVGLWKAFHASGEREYLDLLLEYNQEDCENLQGIMEYVYKKLSNKLYKQENYP